MELEISGKTVELSNQDIAITRKVKDLDNLTLGYIDFTSRFLLPKTQPNKDIFNSGDVIGSDNDYLDKNYPAKVIDQFVLFNGIGFVTESSEGYNFQISDNSRTFFDQLNENINKLDFEADDFTFGSTAYNTLKVATNSIFIWPVISMHEKRISSKIPPTTLNYSRPCINWAILLNEIFSSKGWIVEYNSDILDQIAISTNAKKFYLTSYQKTLDLNLSLSGQSNLTALNTVDFSNGVTLTSTTIDIGSTSTIFRLRGSVSSSNGFKVIFQTTDSPTGNVEIQEFTINSDETEINIITSEFSTDDSINLVEVIIEATGTVEFDDTLLYTLIEEQNLGLLSAGNLSGYRVKAYDNLPDKTQLDIFMDSLLITNSVIIPDSLNKTIYLKSLNQLSKLNSVDWSDKFNQGSEVKYYRNTKYGQINYLLYDNEDDDTIDINVGRNFFEINNQTLPDIVNLFQLKWGASNDVEISQTIADFNVYDDDERINEINDRIVYFNEVSGVTYGRFRELHWQQLKENYYKNWFDSFNRYRVIEGEVFLKKLDMLGFDFMQLVFIEYFDSYFFVLEIEDYIPNKMTKVKLFKFL